MAFTTGPYGTVEAFEDIARGVSGPISGRADLEDYDLAALAKLKGDEVEAPACIVHV